MDWTVLWKLHPELYRFARSLTRNHWQAEDLAQQALLRAMEHAQTLADKPEGYWRGYLYTTVKNAFIDQKRRENREVLPEALPEAAETVDYGMILVSEELERLPENLAKPFHMRFFQGYNSREIGMALGIPEATVRTRLRSAKVLLKKHREEEKP